MGELRGNHKGEIVEVVRNDHLHAILVRRVLNVRRGSNPKLVVHWLHPEATWC